jgi:hypothetical protein
MTTPTNSHKAWTNKGGHVILTLMEIGVLPFRRLARRGRAGLLKSKIGRPQTKTSD